MKSLVKTCIRFFIPSYIQTKSRTVRYAFPMLFLVATALSLGANVINFTNESYIHIESSQTTLKEGDAFTIDVYAYADVPVNAVDIALTFPNQQVSITGVDTGQSVITLWTEQPYVENNTVVLRGGTFRKGFKGNHLIATIKAKALTSGLATFEVSDVTLLAGDGSGSEVTVSQTGEETTKLYIANKDGVFTPQNSASGLEGTISVRIITDIDGDGDVSLADVSRFLAAWTSKTQIFDFSGDGRMTFKDFAIILSDVFFK